VGLASAQTDLLFVLFVAGSFRQQSAFTRHRAE
jgi:hypothetical protein